jgi:hypothetical protein
MNFPASSGFLNSASADGYAISVAGYVGGENVAIEYRWAEVICVYELLDTLLAYRDARGTMRSAFELA